MQPMLAGAMAVLVCWSLLFLPSGVLISFATAAVVRGGTGIKENLCLTPSGRQKIAICYGRYKAQFATVSECLVVGTRPCALIELEVVLCTSNGERRRAAIDSDSDEERLRGRWCLLLPRRFYAVCFMRTSELCGGIIFFEGPKVNWSSALDSLLMKCTTNVR